MSGVLQRVPTIYGKVQDSHNDHGDPWGPIRCAFVAGANPFDIDAVYICSTYSDIFGMTIWSSHNSQHLKRKFWHLWHMLPGSQLKHTKYRTPSRRPCPDSLISEVVLPAVFRSSLTSQMGQAKPQLDAKMFLFWSIWIAENRVCS